MSEPGAVGKAPQRKKLPGALWLLVLLAVPFSAVGIGMFASLVAPAVHDWVRMQTWQAVPAVVESATLESHRGSKGGTAYSVSVRYRYTLDGVAYTGRRAAIHERPDSIGSFQEQLGRRLQGAERSGEPVQVWVNPRNPAESVADRSLRPGLLALALVMSVLSAGFGLVVLGRIVLAVWRGGLPPSQEPAR